MNSFAKSASITYNGLERGLSVNVIGAADVGRYFGFLKRVNMVGSKSIRVNIGECNGTSVVCC